MCSTSCIGSAATYNSSGPDPVSVPGLSGGDYRAEPRVFTGDRRVTIGRCLASRWTPRARPTDKITGQPSGTAATASGPRARQ